MSRNRPRAAASVDLRALRDVKRVRARDARTSAGGTLALHSRVNLSRRFYRNAEVTAGRARVGSSVRGKGCRRDGFAGHPITLGSGGSDSSTAPSEAPHCSMSRGAFVWIFRQSLIEDLVEFLWKCAERELAGSGFP